MRKIPFAGIELTSQRVRGLRGTSELATWATESLYSLLDETVYGIITRAIYMFDPDNLLLTQAPTGTIFTTLLTIYIELLQWLMFVMFSFGGSAWRLI